VQSSLNGQTAIVQDISHAVDGVLAERILKVTAGGKVAGLGLRADEHGTALDVLADRFAVSLPDGSGSKQVFTVGQINGQPAVGIAGAVITDGSLVGKRVLAEESVDAGQINTRGLTIKDAFGNVVVDMNGMGAAHIKGQLTAGQIDSRGLIVRDQNGNIILDSGGLNGSFIKDLTVGTLKIANGAISWTQFVSYVAGGGQYSPNQVDAIARGGFDFYTPNSASLVIQVTAVSGIATTAYLDGAAIASVIGGIYNQIVIQTVGAGSHHIHASNTNGNQRINNFTIRILGVMR